MSYSNAHETSNLRRLSKEERKVLEAGLRSSDAFVLRRCQILLASSKGERPPRIAENLRCGQQTVRNAIHAFNEHGLDALKQGSSRPREVHAAFDEESARALLEMLHQDPRRFGKDGTLWTLEYAAQVSCEEGLTHRRVSAETIRATLVRFGVRWQRAKRWIESPDPEYSRKKGSRSADRLGAVLQDFRDGRRSALLGSVLSPAGRGSPALALTPELILQAPEL